MVLFGDRGRVEWVYIILFKNLDLELLFLMFVYNFIEIYNFIKIF